MKQEQLKEFLFKEYDLIKDLDKFFSEVNYRWIRFYWIVIAAIAVATHYLWPDIIDRGPEFTRKIILILSTFIVGVGFLIFLLATTSRLRSVYYINRLNDIRRVFKESKFKSELKNGITLPTVQIPYLKFSGIDFVVALLIAFVNSAILSCSFSTKILNNHPDFNLEYVWRWFVLSVVLHILFWIIILTWPKFNKK